MTFTILSKEQQLVQVRFHGETYIIHEKDMFKLVFNLAKAVR